MTQSVELYFEHLQGPSPAERRAFFLHGLLGQGGNLRTLARRFLEARPGWDAWLIDLRGHGRSPKSTPEPSLHAAAADVLQLGARSLPVAALIGHSLGGKVALAAAQQGLGGVGALPALSHVVTIDSNPGIRELPATGDSAPAVLNMLAALPPRFETRAAFVAAVAARGHSHALGQWLAMSTEPAPGGGVRFALDLAELAALLRSYLASDLWPVVAAPPASLHVHLVIGERSTAYSAADRARARELSAGSSHISADFLPTDHYVHVEDLEGLLQVLWARIPQVPPLRS
jgi:pimeloyl-ACP methyl ester carboxylesterase